MNNHNDIKQTHTSIFIFFKFISLFLSIYLFFSSGFLSFETDSEAESLYRGDVVTNHSIVYLYYRMLTFLSSSVSPIHFAASLL